MAKFSVAATVPSGNTSQLGVQVANALGGSTTQSVEVVLKAGSYEVRVWKKVRSDRSNKISSSPSTDYSC